MGQRRGDSADSVSLVRVPRTTPAVGPKVSVLLPTHNRPDVLRYAILSVLWQKERDFELLIVGDGCSEDTRAVVAELDDPRIRWFDLPKAPLSGYANRNVALREAKGRFVAYAQDDDIWFPDHLGQLLSTLEAAGAEWGYSRPIWCTPEGLFAPLAINLTNADELTHFLSVENNIPSNCVMHTRSALERAGFWPEDVSRTSDWVLWGRIIPGGGKPVAYCMTPTTIHFRSTARKGDVAAVHRVEEIARGAEWWPKECWIAVPAGTPEQKLVFEAIESAGQAYVEGVRAAVARVLDRLAWSAVFPPAATWHSAAEGRDPPAGLRNQWIKALARLRELGAPRQ
jgi:hypothetical protein